MQLLAKATVAATQQCKTSAASQGLQEGLEVPMDDVVGMQVSQRLQQGLGQCYRHMPLCVLVRVADAVVQDVTLAYILLNCTSA